MTFLSLETLGIRTHLPPYLAMAPTHTGFAPNLETFLSSRLSLEASIESLVAYVKLFLPRLIVRDGCAPLF